MSYTVLEPDWYNIAEIEYDYLSNHQSLQEIEIRPKELFVQ